MNLKRQIQKWMGICGLFLLAATLHGQEPAFTLPPFQNLGGLGSRGTYGWDFTVNSPIRVSALGLFDSPFFQTSIPGDGLLESHAIGLWRAASDSPLLATATLAAGTDARLFANFRYQSIDPVDLEPGQYVIGAYFSGNNADFQINV